MEGDLQTLLGWMNHVHFCKHMNYLGKCQKWLQSDCRSCPWYTVLTADPESPQPITTHFAWTKWCLFFRFVFCRPGPVWIWAHFFPHYLLAFNSPWCRLCPLGGRKEPFVLQGLSLEMSQNFKEKGNTQRSYTCFSHWLKCDLESSKRENIGRNSGSEFK